MMTKQQGIGTYLAQGWAAHAGLTYLFILGWMLYLPASDLPEVLLIAMPIYCFINGSVGAIVAAIIWSFEFACRRRLNVTCRAIGGILLPITLSAAIAALGGFLHEIQTLLWVAGLIAAFVFLPILLAGVRFNPLRLIVMDLQRNVPDYGWVRALTLLTVPLLRIIGALGMLEAFLYLACVRPSEFGAWDFAAKDFLGAIAAVVYFTITLVVALCLPQKILAVAIGIVTNLPVAAFALMALNNSGWTYRLVSILGSVLIVLWALFVLSRPSRVTTRRLVPVTLFEIRIRHALNYW